MIHYPPTPDAPDGRARAPVAMRFEDVTQDGRLTLEALPNGIGEAVWRGSLEHHPMTAAFRAAGVLPILTRLVVEGTAGPFAVAPAPEGRGAWQLAHVTDDDGAVKHIALNMWVELFAPRGRTFGPPPDGAGATLCAGRVFGEHVFTRPFASAGARRVTTLALPGVPDVPGPRYRPRSNDALLALPDGAMALDAAVVLDAVPVPLGIGHTDSNQHVNSLVYPRLLEEAALRRFALHRRGSALAPRAFEIAFRKPCFAGETVRLALQAYACGDTLGVAGVFLAEADAHDLASARPRAYGHMVFEP